MNMKTNHDVSTASPMLLQGMKTVVDFLNLTKKESKTVKFGNLK